MEHELWTVPLRLRYAFGLSRGTASRLPTVLLRLADGGLGEAAPVRYLGHTPEALHAAIAALCGALHEDDLEDMSKSAGEFTTAPAPARAAVDIARWDLAARARGVSLHAHLAARIPDPRDPTDLTARTTDLTTRTDLTTHATDLTAYATDLTTTDLTARATDLPPRTTDLTAHPTATRPGPADLGAARTHAGGRPAGAPPASTHTRPGAAVTSYTVALDDLDTMAARAAEAAHLPLLKLKLGRDPVFDREALRRVAAAAPRARLRVDANGGWTLAQARELLPALADLGVEFVEQPLARGQLDALAELRRGSPLPLYADEDVQGPASLAALRGRVDGVNIKLMKCGGISPALAMIAAARREGWRVLIGCMIETRVGLAAAASLADRVDELDLDAHMLTLDDPVPPGSQRALSPDLPLVAGPGLGVPLRW